MRMGSLRSAWMVFGALALVAAATTALSPPPGGRSSETGAMMIVTVWEDIGVQIKDATVTAKRVDGRVRGQPRPDGSIVLADVGAASAGALETILRVEHPEFGREKIELAFVPKTVLLVALVYDERGKLEVYSPDLLPDAAASSGGAPDNDLCDAGCRLFVDPGDSVGVIGTTDGATFDAVGTCGTTNTAPGVWYTVTGTGNMMTASTCNDQGDGFDTKLSVFCGECDDLTCVGGNDDDAGCSDGSFLSTVTWCTEQGTDYRILVHGAGSETGEFGLIVSDDDTPCTATVSCQPECFLVIGDDPGTSRFTGANHKFTTQVGPGVDEHHAVLMDDIPEFVLPIQPRRQYLGWGGKKGGPPNFVVGEPGPVPAETPSWMLDMSFAVQVLMWNPQVFPSLPEQYTAGLEVTLLPNGGVTSTQYGTDLGGLDIWHEIDVNAEGQRVIRFPFVVPGL